MIKRCIMIFPQFENVDIIDEVRRKYDPLAKHVRPHITLVFPFDSDIETSQLREHISSVLLGYKPFDVVLKGITPTRSFGKYLFLNIQNGSDKIIELHKLLYTGILREHFPEWLEGDIFLPHMTVGSFECEQAFESAIDETKNITDTFRSTVNEITVEVIDNNSDSLIEISAPLK